MSRSIASFRFVPPRAESAATSKLIHQITLSSVSGSTIDLGSQFSLKHAIYIQGIYVILILKINQNNLWILCPKYLFLLC